jgi:serine/threonine protein kinase
VLPAAWGNAPELRARLRAEAAALQRIDHPNVVKVLEVGEVDGQLGGGCYIALEWLPQALDRVMRAQYPEPLRPAAALRLARGVSDGLAATHAVGLLHRDVKPSNVLLRTDGTPVLTDFGLATAIAETAIANRLTPHDMVVGTADYMAPEQIEGVHMDHRADIYALGVVLYELVAGHVPFAGRDPMQTFKAHQEEEPPPLPLEIPSSVRELVARALQKDPDDRFASASAMALEIEQVLDDDLALAGG